VTGQAWDPRPWQTPLRPWAWAGPRIHRQIFCGGLSTLALGTGTYSVNVKDHVGRAVKVCILEYTAGTAYAMSM
jgi:hypothetical protein